MFCFQLVLTLCKFTQCAPDSNCPEVNFSILQVLAWISYINSIQDFHFYEIASSDFGISDFGLNLHTKMTPYAN